MRRFRERKSEGREFLAGTQPHEAAATQIDIGLERCRVPRADPAVEAIGGHHHVRIECTRRCDIVGHIVLEHEFDTQRFAARLQDVKQALAADAAEAVAAARDRASLEMDVDIVPAIKRADDFARRFRVRRSEVA